MTQRLSVGVVIPVYAVADHVGGCIASIAQQVRLPDQVILVDDRSDDGSIEAAIAAAGRYSLPIEVLRHERNRGLSAARNSGLARLATDLVWFCDSDDTADPQFVAKMAGAIEDSDASFAMCRTLRVDRHGNRLGIEEKPFAPGQTMPGVECVRHLLTGEFSGYACNKIFRRELLGEKPYVEGQVYEDLAPAVAMALASPEVALVNEPLYRYLANDVSVSRSFGPHTGDIFSMGQQVETIMAETGLLLGADQRLWRETLVKFRYNSVVLPAANMASHALTDKVRNSSEARHVVTRAQGMVSMRDVFQLGRSGALRQALAGLVLAVSVELYRRILTLR